MFLLFKDSVIARNFAIENPENYEARANMMWASFLAHNGLTQCGRFFQLTVHQFEHEVSGMWTSILNTRKKPS